MKYLVVSFFINILILSVNAQEREKKLSDIEKRYVYEKSGNLSSEILLFWKTVYKDSVDRPISKKSSFWTNSICGITHLHDERNILKSSDKLVASKSYTSQVSFYAKDIGSSLKKVLFLQENISNNINDFVKTYTDYDFSNCDYYKQDTHLINKWFESYKIVKIPESRPEGIYYDEIIGKNYLLKEIHDPYYNMVYQIIMVPNLLEDGKGYIVIRYNYKLNYYKKS